MAEGPTQTHRVRELDLEHLSELGSNSLHLKMRIGSSSRIPYLGDGPTLALALFIPLVSGRLDHVHLRLGVIDVAAPQKELRT